MEISARRSSLAHLILVAALLWLVYFIRAYHPLAMPAFVDESLHILRGRVVWRFSDLGESLTPGKLLYYYWIGLFGLNGPESLWLARIVTALAALPGAALTYALARLLFDRRAGLLALALYALMPFMVFFERMALADAFTAVWCTALACASIRLARRPSVRRGMVAGALLGVAMLAKLIALPVGGLIVLALGLFAPRQTHLHAGVEKGINWVRYAFAPPYRRPLWGAVLGLFLVFVPSTVYVTAKEIAGIRDRVVVNPTLYTTDDRDGQIVKNTERTLSASIILLSPELVALTGVLAAYLAWRKPRVLAFLMAGVILPCASVILVSSELSTRYLVLGIPPLLVLIAGGVTDASGWVRQHRGGVIEPNWQAVSRIHWLAWGLLGAWTVSFAIPFARTAIIDPAALDLPSRDRWEYLTFSSSGYALRDLARDVPHLPPDADGRIPLVGFLSSCHSLPLYWTAENAVDLDCPLFKWDVSKQQEMRDHLVGMARAHPVLYMAVERMSLFDLDQLPLEWEHLAEYPRPHHGVTVTLYRVRLAE